MSGDSSEPRQVRCPACGGPSLYDSRNHFRPFCGERCKQIDLGAWASESFKVAASAVLATEDEAEWHNAAH